MDTQIKITEIDDSIYEKKTQRLQDLADLNLQSALTLADTNQATGTYSLGTAAIINNHTARILQIESALINVGILTGTYSP